MYVKVLKPFVFLVVVIAMVSLACLGGSETPAPEPPPAPEEPAAPPNLRNQRSRPARRACTNQKSPLRPPHKNSSRKNSMVAMKTGPTLL